MDHMQTLGVLALGSRLKRLSDRFMADGARFYKEASVDFQPKWFPLFTLVREVPGITLSDASERLGQSHAAISQAAQAMVKAGWLNREDSSQDARSKVLSLTSHAHTQLPQLDALWQAVLAANLQLQHQAGVDLLQAMEAMEQALDNTSFYQRLSAQKRALDYDAVEIIPYAAEYKEYVGALNREWLEKYFRVEPRDQQMFDDPEGEIIGTGGQVMFARIDGEIVGTCSLYFYPNGIAELIRLGVTAKYQRRQIARKLCLAIIDLAREQGVKDLYITTNSSLSPALALYRKLGFVTEDFPELIAKYERVDTVLRLPLQCSGEETAQAA